MGERYDVEDRVTGCDVSVYLADRDERLDADPVLRLVVERSELTGVLDLSRDGWERLKAAGDRLFDPIIGSSSADHPVTEGEG